MNDRRKTKAQLIEELEALRARVAVASPAPKRDLASEPALLDRFASTGFWVVDTDFAVRMVNQTMLDLLGDKASEVIGKKCYELLGGPRCHTHECSLRRVFADGGVETFAESRTPRDQIPLQCRVVARMLRDLRSDAIGVIEEISAPHAHERVSPSVLVDRPAADVSDFAQQVARLAHELARSVDDNVPARALAHELLAVCASFAGSPHPGDEACPAQRTVLVVAPSGGTWTDEIETHVTEGGYSVITTRTPAEAEQLLARRPAIDIAVIDLALRNPESALVFARLREVRPLLSVLALSSGGSDALERRRWRRPRTWYLRQPIDAESLYAVLTDVAPLPRAAPDA